MTQTKAKIYVYDGCDSCRKAVKFLSSRGVAYDCIPIRTQPPSVEELIRMRQLTGDLKRLFNTSGQDYKAMGMKDRLPGMTEAEALDLLHALGNLVKRPFLLLPDGRGTTGFKEIEWDALLSG